ncbi:K+/H+ antiporter [Virgisporangium aliadipatigenens]|uniref:K+/H+ antiporter n=1 Tax=Virgisporangium aliadipatigenens TaxID=741659 RepID=A0A8J3YUA5_9ACTN|nr:potassium/proton antiporter [Virgisporangium aliadipatigenens]GIJ49926.1 K+/H+ antiporter [Virgisporangium aliadipatigenens]
MTDQVNGALLLGAVVLLVAVAAVRLSTRLGLPSLLVYLALGLLLGPLGLGLAFNDAELTRVLGLCALVVIIAEGGLTARWAELRPVVWPAAVLSTVGVGVSVAVVAFAAHLLLGLDWRLAWLYGAVLSSTDAAAVFATLRRLRVRPRLAALLEAESGINDAPVVLLVIALSVLPGENTHAAPWWQHLLLGAYELGAGAVLGVAVGAIGAWTLRRAALPAAGLYPLATVGLTVLAYAVGLALHASGFLAVYACGVVLGNAHLPHRRAVLGFADGLAWLAQIGLFVLLGLLAEPRDLLVAIVPGLVIGLVLVLLARPLSVLVSATPFRFPLREQVFLSWAGLRGAVPIVLATIPLSVGLPGAKALFNVVFVLVVVYTVAQGASLPPVARRLGVAAPAEPTELDVETAPLERMRADLLQLEIPEGSRLAGVHIDELRLPEGAAIMLVTRDGAGFVPSGQTRLRTGDSLLLVATEGVRAATEQRLRAVSRRGRLARWFADYGEDLPPSQIV